MRVPLQHAACCCRFGWTTSSALERSNALAKSVTSMSVQSVAYWLQGSNGFVGQASWLMERRECGSAVR